MKSSGRSLKSCERDSVSRSLQKEVLSLPAVSSINGMTSVLRWIRGIASRVLRASMFAEKDENNLMRPSPKMRDGNCGS